ncbi:MAG TPA: PQQ-binding-like beta-propeller repeat protein, partial [Acidobacteriota bacterium]
VVALDKSNGREIWKHIRESDARDECEHSYASPFLYRDSKHEFLLIHGADYITAHRVADGAEIWRCGGLNLKSNYNPAFRFVASPVATAGLIVVPSAKNGPVLGLKPDGTGDITNLKQHYAWILSHGTPDVPSPLIYGGLVYLCKEDGELICLDAKTGQKIYHEQTRRTRHRASPVYAGGKIYLTARDGVVTVVKAGRQFQILSQNELGETISASPIISNGRIYLRTYEALYAIG